MRPFYLRRESLLQILRDRRGAAFFEHAWRASTSALCWPTGQQSGQAVFVQVVVPEEVIFAGRRGQDEDSPRPRLPKKPQKTPRKMGVNPSTAPHDQDSQKNRPRIPQYFGRELRLSEFV